MLEHVEKYEMINKIQFGFLKRKSSNVSFIVDRTSEQFVGKNETVVSIFIDFTKSFNSISQNFSHKNLQNMDLVRNQLQC